MCIYIYIHIDIDIDIYAFDPSGRVLYALLLSLLCSDPRCVWVVSGAYVYIHIYTYMYTCTCVYSHGHRYRYGYIGIQFDSCSPYPGLSAGATLLRLSAPTRGVCGLCLAHRVAPHLQHPERRNTGPRVRALHVEYAERRIQVVFYSYIACFMNTLPLHMYGLLSYTGLTSRNT